MGQAADRWADTVILTSDNPRSEDPEVIIEAIRVGISRGAEGARQIPDRREAIREACRISRPGDAVLIAGKGHEREQIFADRIIPFDDREVARQALADLPERNS
jgi:UDP-N-acetylmuramoyl-L-alanyl-D-glutamate--2,6-diaminopimelate ligase